MAWGFKIACLLPSGLVFSRLNSEVELLFIFQAFSFGDCRCTLARLEKVQEVVRSLQQEVTTLDGFSPVVRSLYERFNRVNRVKYEEWSNFARKILDYYTLWARKLKTVSPLASWFVVTSKMLLSQKELVRITTYTERTALCSHGKFHPGLIVSTISIDVIRPLLKNMRRSFIRKKLHLNYVPTGKDRWRIQKWLRCYRRA